jgi:hypothetical protein
MKECVAQGQGQEYQKWFVGEEERIQSIVREARASAIYSTIATEDGGAPPWSYGPQNACRSK